MDVFGNFLQTMFDAMAGGQGGGGGGGGAMGSFFNALFSAIGRRRTVKDVRRMIREQGYLQLAGQMLGGEIARENVRYTAELEDYYRNLERMRQRQGLENWSRAGLGVAGAPQDAIPYFAPFAWQDRGPPSPNDPQRSDEAFRAWVERINRAFRV